MLTVQLGEERPFEWHDDEQLGSADSSCLYDWRTDCSRLGGIWRHVEPRAGFEHGDQDFPL